MAPAEHSAENLTVAVVQMCSGDRVEDNLAAAGDLLRQAADAGARLAVLPENFGFMGRRERDRVEHAEPPGEGPQQAFLRETAADLGIYLVGGTLPVLDPGENRPAACCLVCDPEGRVIARYDKIHLFDVAVPDTTEQYLESSGTLAGETPVLADTPLGALGLTVCYDIRFPELYRSLVRGGARAFSIPAAFTMATGEAHWEILVKARAIENQAFVLAATQGGQHPGGRRTWGRATIVDPWGRTLAERPEGPGIAVASLDLEGQTALRTRFPALEHAHKVLEHG